MLAGWPCHVIVEPRRSRSTRVTAWSAICPVNCYQDLIVEQASQEHGILAIGPDRLKLMPDLPIGREAQDPAQSCLRDGVTA